MALVVSLAAASLGGLKVGFDLGVLNPCMRYVSDDLSLEPYQEGFVMVLLIISASAGALGAGRMADSIGLIPAQLVTAILGAVGSALSAAAFGPAGVWIMSIGRLIAGLGCGACTVLCPRYIAEFSPSVIRGALSCATQLSICMGLLVSYLLGLPYEHGVTAVSIGSNTLHWWRAVHILGAMISLIQIAVLSRSVESPAWLEHHGQYTQAQINRTKLLGGPTDSLPMELPFGLGLDAVQQVEPLLPTFEEVRSFEASMDPNLQSPERTGVLQRLTSEPLTRRRCVQEALSRPSVGIKTILSTPEYRYSAFLAISVAVFQQLSGINTVMLYSAPILDQAGLDSPIMATVLVGLINTVMTMCTAGLVDKHGRRLILLVSHAGCAVSLAVLALAGLAEAAPIMVVAMLGFVAFFAVGSGPVPFMYISEVLSPSIKGSVASAAMAGNWGCNVAVVALFPMAAEAFGLGPTYCVFVVFNILAAGFCIWFMVETKQLSMKEIQEAIMKRAV